jgi:hypothetical protein
MLDQFFPSCLTDQPCELEKPLSLDIYVVQPANYNVSLVKVTEFHDFGALQMQKSIRVLDFRAKLAINSVNWCGGRKPCSSKDSRCFSGNGTVSVARLKPKISTVPTLVSRAMEIESLSFFRALGTWIERHGFGNDPENRHFNE